jgi:hypothetical protein
MTFPLYLIKADNSNRVLENNSTALMQPASATQARDSLDKKISMSISDASILPMVPFQMEVKQRRKGKIPKLA